MTKKINKKKVNKIIDVKSIPSWEKKDVEKVRKQLGIDKVFIIGANESDALYKSTCCTGLGFSPAELRKVLIQTIIALDKQGVI